MEGPRRDPAHPPVPPYQLVPAGDAGHRRLHGARGQGAVPMSPSDRLRRFFRYVLAGLAVVVIAGGAALYVQGDQVREVRRVAGENKQLIRQVDDLNRRQADAAYSECMSRNKRSVQAQADLERLVRAHRLDGSSHAQAVWSDYLANLKKAPLPDCKKPS